MRPLRLAVFLLVLGTAFGIGLFAPALANAQSVRCIPDFGPAGPEDRCDDSSIDSRNPLPDAWLAIALSANGSVGAGWAPGENDAARNAVASCTKYGGQNCKVAKSYFNTCASVASSASEKIVAISALKGAGWNASALAITKCQQSGGHSCRLMVNACANGYVSPRPYTPPSAGSHYEAPVLRRR